MGRNHNIDYRPAIHRDTVVYINGEVKHLRVWAQTSPVTLDTILRRLNDGWSVRMAVMEENSRCDKEILKKARSDRVIEVACRSISVWFIKSAILELFQVDKKIIAETSSDEAIACLGGDSRILIKNMAVQQAAMISSEEWFSVCSDHNEGKFFIILNDEDSFVTTMGSIVSILGGFIVGISTKENTEMKLDRMFEKYRPFKLIECSNKKIIDVAKAVLRWS